MNCGIVLILFAMAGIDQPANAQPTPAAKKETPRARDANLPPPAPMLGRRVPDRVPFSDPTAELGNSLIVGTAAKMVLPLSGFFKAVVPDPFELGTQVKPKVPPAAEPSALPVPVTPQRVK